MLSLRKEAERTCSQQLFAPAQQLGQGGQRAGRDHIDLAGKAADRAFDAGGMDPHPRPGHPRCVTQESAFPAVALDQVDPPLARLGETDPDHQAGEAAARSEVEPAPLVAGQREQLQRIRDMARPDIGQRRGGDEVLGGLPARELRYEQREALLCFT